MVKTSKKESGSDNDTKVNKSAGEKTIRLVDEAPTPTNNSSSGPNEGSFNSTDGAWEVQYPQDTKMTVKNFNGRVYVDIRKMWQGKPTKKGISLSPEVFEQIRSWTGMEKALASLKK